MALRFKMRMFANDTVLYALGSSEEETVHKLNKDVISHVTIFEKTTLFSTLRKTKPKQRCLEHQNNLLNVLSLILTKMA